VVVRLRGASDVMDSIKQLWTDVSFFEVLLVLEDLEGFKIGVLKEPTLVKTIECLRQVDSSKRHDVSR
jgi:hypothetical protein